MRGSRWEGSNDKKTVGMGCHMPRQTDRHSTAAANGPKTIRWHVLCMCGLAAVRASSVRAARVARDPYGLVKAGPVPGLDIMYS